MTFRSRRDSKNKQNLRFVLALLLSVPLLFASACGGSSNGGGTPPSSPTITSVSVACSPASIQTTQTSTCTSTVAGTGSFSSSVTWSVSPASIGAVSGAGVLTPVASGTATVTATSTQDTTKSGGATVTVAPSSNPLPTITALSPASLGAGAASQTLTINGTGFLTASTVTFNGIAHTSTFVNGSQLTISLTKADLATSGSYPVVVTNPTPGGGSSAPVNFAVSASNPVPAVTSLSPSSLAAGSAAQTLAINGTEFLVTSTVTFNGVAHTSAYVNGSQLTVSLTTADLATAGSYPVVVTNPTPGGGSSTAVNFTVSTSNPVPTLISIFPVSVLAGSGDTTVAVTGAGFVRSSVVAFNGQALATNYVSSTSLTVLVPSSQLSLPGTDTISVTTPAPAGGTSSAAQFTITQVVSAANLVLLGTPTYSGSPTGPWLLSVAAVDSNGNPVPNLRVALTSSEGSITQNSVATDSAGRLTASITPPSSYSNEVVEVSAVSGNQTAVVDIVFAASSTTVGQQALAAMSARNSFGTRMNSLRPAGSSGATGSSAGISPLVFGQSNGSASKNVFSGMQSPCISNQGLDTTVSVDCQSTFNLQQMQLTPYSLATSACSVIGTITEVVDCAGATGVLVACVASATGIGAVICDGGIEAGLPQSCLLDIGSQIAQSSVSNPLLKVGIETTVNVISLFPDTTLTPTATLNSLIAMACNVVDAGNVGGGGNTFGITAKSSSVNLGGQTPLAATNATGNIVWSVSGSGPNGVLGTIDASGIYTAPLVAPSDTYCNFVSSYFVDACPVTILATDGNNDHASTTIVLSIGSSLSSPSVSSFSPNSITAGALAQPLFVNGSGFLDGDTVTFNGVARQYSFIGTGQLKVFLLASDLASAGSFPVVVTHSFAALPNDGGFASANFPVALAQTPVPPVPSPGSPGTPADTGYLVTTITPTLQWIGPGATQYDLAISEYPYGTSNVVFDSGILNGGTSSLTLPSGYLMNGIKYRWNIQAHNSAGWSAVSSSLYFTVGAGSLPTAPNPISPGTSIDTEYTVSSSTPTMQWSGSGARTYELAISKSPYGPSNVIYDNAQLPGSDTSFPLPTGVLQNGVKYRWDMQATNTAGQSSWSSPLYFIVDTGSGGAPPVPSPLSPGTNTDTGYQVTTTTPTMNWSGSGATQYELAISFSPYGSNNLAYDTLVTGSVTSLQVPTGNLQNGVKYRWDMQATNAGGQSSWSAPLYFTLNTSSSGAPAVPTGLSPGSTSSPGPTVTTLTPTLSWSASNGATGYSVAVSQLNGGVVCAQNVTTNSASCPAFQNGSTYFWTVSASNSAGSSATAAIVYFTVNTAAVPPTPTGLSPGSTSSPGATVTTLTPTLSWNASTGATAYSFAISQLNGGVVYAANLSTNSATIPAGKLTSGATYFWTVSASNAAGSSATATILYFTVNTATIPPTPTGLSPGSASSPGPTVTTLTPTLVWNASTGATAYSVAISQLNGGIVYAANVSTNSAPVSAGKLASGSTYFWSVSASNSAGSSATAAIVYFTVNTATVPPTPTGLSPGSTSSPGPTVTTLTPILSWNASTGATAYSVAVSQLNGGVVYAANVATNSAPIPTGKLTSGATYFWTLSASNSAGSSATATIVYFTVKTTTVPATPTGLSPGNTSSPGPTVTTLTPTFTWNASTGATAYSVAVSQLNGGAVCSENVTTNSATCPALQNGATYFWGASASNSAGSSSTSSVVYFTVSVATVPAAPSLDAPGSSTSPGPKLTRACSHYDLDIC
jgi:hypothetical protein